jgi:hypothetical protein
MFDSEFENPVYGIAECGWTDWKIFT